MRTLLVAVSIALLSSVSILDDIDNFLPAVLGNVRKVNDLAAMQSTVMVKRCAFVFVHEIYG